MDFNLSDLQRMMLDSAQRLLADRYTLEHRRSLRDGEGFDAEAWASFAEMGWLALATPEALGGLGGSMEDVAVLMTALGGKLVTEPVVSSAVLAAHILSAADTAQHDLLASIGGGERRVALAHDEPGERYACSARRSTTLSASGDGFRLAGQKMLVLDAASATHFIVSASIDGQQGFVLALVDANASGVSANGYMLVDGSRAADVHFDLDIAADAILVTAGRGVTVLGSARSRPGRAAGAGSRLDGGLPADLFRLPEGAPAIRPADR
jgi:alkylation response protein AidB-like acyl-CoA dehydrogenase